MILRIVVIDHRETLKHQKKFYHNLNDKIHESRYMNKNLHGQVLQACCECLVLVCLSFFSRENTQEKTEKEEEEDEKRYS